ncbi:hypothetical protein V6N11_049865 [Hibiscus sabdariffa]|uniref:Uncharacterized protein n=1 Tax=Hibiscus sabdariffa TaxID=183260 RepID=A0ABR2T8S8_9ROSI
MVGSGMPKWWQGLSLETCPSSRICFEVSNEGTFGGRDRKPGRIYHILSFRPVLPNSPSIPRISFGFVRSNSRFVFVPIRLETRIETMKLVYRKLKGYLLFNNEGRERKHLESSNNQCTNIGNKRSKVTTTTPMTTELFMQWKKKKLVWPQNEQIGLRMIA